VAGSNPVTPTTAPAANPAPSDIRDNQTPRQRGATVVKSTVEKLSPTRVRINVEVPFTELQPDFDRAYKELAKQVRLPGFRPGKAPAKLLEARIGREAMLDQVVSDAIPARYSEAVASSDVRP